MHSAHTRAAFRASWFSWLRSSA